MRKRFVAVLLAFFLVFSIVSSDYFSVKTNAAATGAAVAVAGGGFAAGAAALLPVIAVVGLCALGGYGIYSYVSANAAEQGLTNTEYMQSVFEDFCESTGQSTTAQANAMMNDVTVMQDGTIGITNAASGAWHDFLDWMATSAGAGELENYASVDDFPMDGLSIGNYKAALISQYDIGSYHIVFSKPVYVGYFIMNNGMTCFEYFTFNSNVTFTSTNIYNGYSTSGTLSKSSFTLNGVEFYYNSSTMNTKERPGNIPLNSVNLQSQSSNSHSITGAPDVAFIGDFADMTGAATYQGMDVLTGDQAFVLNPDITDAIARALEGAISSALTLDIPTYLNLVMEVVNGAPTISIPYENTYIDIVAPTFAPTDNSITNNIDITEGTTIINIVNPIPAEDAIDLAGLAAGMNMIVGWAVDYISPQKGILSKFPFSIAYDMYLLIAAMAGESADAINADPKNLSIENDLSPPSAEYSEMKSALVFHVVWRYPTGTGWIETPITLDLSQFEWFSGSFGMVWGSYG